LLRAFDDDAWNHTVYLIRGGQCTPFIGAGASVDQVPLAAELAAGLSEEYGFPFEETRDLARVAQYAAIHTDSRMYIKKRLVDDMLAALPRPDFGAPDEPHALLADLQLPVYVTTNYDDFMYEALVNRDRLPQRAVCPWYTTDAREIAEAASLFQDPAGYNPHPARPIVYHLHGHPSVPESIVLTEDDYIDFLVRISANPDLLPPVIAKSLRSRMLLFIGYSLTDWTFRVIFRGLLSARPPNSGHRHVSVQLPPLPDGEDGEKAARAQEYLDRLFEKQSISICWKQARDFTAELRRRWETS
jgi:hypothetical protein